MWKVPWSLLRDDSSWGVCLACFWRLDIKRHCFERNSDHLGAGWRSVARTTVKGIYKPSWGSSTWHQKDQTHLHLCGVLSNVNYGDHHGLRIWPLPRFQESCNILRREQEPWDLAVFLANVATGALGLIFFRKPMDCFLYLNVEG